MIRKLMHWFRDRKLRTLDAIIADLDAAIEACDECLIGLTDEIVVLPRGWTLGAITSPRVSVYYDPSRCGYWIGDRFVSDADVYLRECPR